MTLRTFASALATGVAVAGLSAGAAMADGSWPDLPVGVKSGISARVGDTAYVGLGSAGAGFFSLDLANPSEGWVRRAAFDGPATSGAAAAVSNGRIFVFSGNGKPTPDAASPIIFDTVHVYDTASDAWSTVDTTTPGGLSGAKALALSDGRIAIIGGYSKAQFDTYLADVAAIKETDPDGFKALVEAYMGREPEAYGRNAEVLAYDPAANSWGTLGDNPHLPNCDSAVVGQGDGAFLVIGGEIKPGLRTPQVKSVSVDGATATWQERAVMPAPAGEAGQEGVAGAYAAAVAGVVLVAGARPRLWRVVRRSRRPARGRRRGRRGQSAQRGLRSEVGRQHPGGRRLRIAERRRPVPIAGPIRPGEAAWRSHPGAIDNAAAAA